MLPSSLHLPPELLCPVRLRTPLSNFHSYSLPFTSTWAGIHTDHTSGPEHKVIMASASIGLSSPLIGKESQPLMSYNSITESSVPSSANPDAKARCSCNDGTWALAWYSLRLPSGIYNFCQQQATLIPAEAFCKNQLGDSIRLGPWRFSLLLWLPSWHRLYSSQSLCRVML
jgi:hypothetical protein